MRVLEKIEKIIEYWYATLISGIIAIVAGSLILVFANDNILAICLIFSLFFLLSGSLETVSSIINRKKMKNVVKHIELMIMIGSINLIFGVLLLLNPFRTIIAIALFVGLSVLFRCFGIVIFSRSIKNTNPKWKYLQTFGIVGVIFSVLLIVNLFFTHIVIIASTGITLTIAGIFSICLSYYLKGLKEKYRDFILSKIVDGLTMDWVNKNSKII